MVHERDDEYEGQEDGEYHFSDDQANYEMEPEVEKQPVADAPKSTKKSSSGGRFDLGKYRRPMIGAGIFFFLIFLVYKIMVPSSNAPSVEFAQNGTPAATTTTKTVTKTHPVVVQKVVAAPAPIQTAPAPSPVVAEAAKPPAIVTTTTTTQPAIEMPNQQHTMTQPTPITVTTVAQQPGVPVSANEMTSAQTANAVDKLIALQDQNTKLVNQLQTESAQKIADYEAQSIAMQGKLQDMNMRMASIETTLARLSKTLQDMKSGNEGGPTGRAELSEGGPQQAQPMMARPIVQARSAYTVQAIIPGRAWLKAENGETVTVAEGDIIKNYGRITKIDPYDGVVQIDSGGRVVTLSYGAGTE